MQGREGSIARLPFMSSCRRGCMPSLKQKRLREAADMTDELLQVLCTDCM